MADESTDASGQQPDDGADESARPYEVEPTPEDAGVEAEPGEPDRSGVLDGFDEDADFDRDPEVEAALGGVVAGPEPESKPRERAALVRSGLGGPRVLGGIGLVLLAAAAISSGIGAEAHPLARGVLTAYNTLLHAGTGVVALLVTATIVEKRLGAVELAAGRMFVAVGAFAFVYRIGFLGSLDWAPPVTTPIYLLSGALVYLLLLVSTFRLSRYELGVTAGTHVLLWIIVWIGSMLSQTVGSG